LGFYEHERIEITTPLQNQARQQGQASPADDQADQLRMGFEAALASRRKNYTFLKNLSFLFVKQ
jgi:salicylate hydroxylase